MEYGIFEVIATMDEKPKSPWQVMKNENKNVVLVKKFDESEEWSNIFNYFESHCDSFIEEYRMKYVCEISFLSKLHNEIEEGSIVNDDYYDDIVLITSIEPDSEEDRTYFEIEAENYAPDYSTGKYGLFEARASDKKGFESAYDVIEKDNWLSEPIDVFENLKSCRKRYLPLMMQPIVQYKQLNNGLTR